jgi:hypothetical protein
MSSTRRQDGRPTARLAVRLLPLWGLLTGLVVGAAWGALARLWMRLLTTGRPEFTWSGTLFIVGAFALAGMTAGAVVGARRRRWRGHPMRALRMVGFSGTLFLSLGQGALMAPTLVLGGLAIARRGWPVWLRTVLALLALGPVAFVHAAAWSEWPHTPLRLVAALALCLVVYGGAVAALAQSYALTPGAELPRKAWLALLLLPLAVLFTLGVDSVGTAGALIIVLGSATVASVAVIVSRRRATATAAAVPQQRAPSPVCVDAEP